MISSPKMTMEDFLTCLGCTSSDPMEANDLMLMLELFDGNSASGSATVTAKPSAVQAELAHHR